MLILRGTTFSEIEAKLLEVWQVESISQSNFTISPFCPSNFAVVAQAAIINGDDVHAFHMTYRND